MTERAGRPWFPWQQTGIAARSERRLARPVCASDHPRVQGASGGAGNSGRRQCTESGDVADGWDQSARSRAGERTQTLGFESLSPRSSPS